VPQLPFSIYASPGGDGSVPFSIYPIRTRVFFFALRISIYLFRQNRCRFGADKFTPSSLE